MKMKTVPLADVLWTAANKHLGAVETKYSCFAVWDACDDNAAEEIATNFLRSLGVETGTVMEWFPIGPVRQGVRYMWLLLAMHVAADEGLTVEIPS